MFVVKWVLVLTLFSSYGTGEESSVTVVPVPFESKQECLDAGNAWIAKTGGAALERRALCMQQTTKVQ